MDSFSALLAIVGIVAPITIGVVEVLKRATHLAERFAPLAAIISGVALAYLVVAAGVVVAPLTPPGIVLCGLLSGLVASGLYSGVKATVT